MNAFFTRLAIACLTLASITVQAQQVQLWQATGAGTAVSSVSDPFGNTTVMYGITNGAGKKQIVQQKFNNQGIPQWTKTFDFEPGGDVIGENLATDNAGNTYGCGVVTPQGSTQKEVLVYSADPAGNIRWVKLQEQGTKVDMVDLKLNGNNIVLTGSIIKGMGAQQAFVTQLALTDGAIGWFKLFANAVGKASGGGGVSLDDSGNVYASVDVFDVVGEAVNDSHLWKLETDGDTVYDVAAHLDGQIMSVVDVEYKQYPLNPAYIYGATLFKNTSTNDTNMGLTSFNPDTGAVVDTTFQTIVGHQEVMQIGLAERGPVIFGTDNVGTNNSQMSFTQFSPVGNVQIISNALSVHTRARGGAIHVNKILVWGERGTSGVGDGLDSFFCEHDLDVGLEGRKQTLYNVPGDQWAQDGSYTPSGAPVVFFSKSATLGLEQFLRGVNGITVPAGLLRGGNSIPVVFNFEEPAPENIFLRIQGNSSRIQAPVDAIPIPEGATSFQYNLSTLGVLNDTNVKVFGGIVGNAGFYNADSMKQFTLSPAVLKSLSIDKPIVPSGTSTMGYIDLDGKSPSTGSYKVQLSSNSTAVHVPAEVTFSPDSPRYGFAIDVSPISGSATRQIKAFKDAQQKALNIGLSAAFDKIIFDKIIVKGGYPVTGTASVRGTATVDSPISLTTNSSAIQVPPTVTVPNGSATQTFEIETSWVSATATRTITATMGTVSNTKSLTLEPGPKLITFNLSSSSVVGGQNITGTVGLSQVSPGGGTPISINESTSMLISPTTVAINSGVTSANFTIGTTPLGTTTTRGIQAEFGGITINRSITVNPAGLSVLSISPNSVKGGNPTTGTITLNGPAAGAGKVVSLSDNTTVVSTPASATVPAGASTKTFAITTSPVSSTVTRQVSATADGTTKTANITLTP